MLCHQFIFCFLAGRYRPNIGLAKLPSQQGNIVEYTAQNIGLFGFNLYFHNILFIALSSL